MGDPLYYVGIDPGLRHAGWATVDLSGALIACGLARGLATGRGVDAWQRVAHEAVDAITTEIPVGTHGADLLVTVELPRIYAAGKMKGDPDDIVVLAAVVGSIVGAVVEAGANATVVRPADWKGQVPKDVHNRRILSGLSVKEEFALNGCGAPSSLRHNVIDAIGLAKWAARRGAQSGPW